MLDFIQSKIKNSITLKTELLNNHQILEQIVGLVNDITNCYKNGGKVLWCGNGGSAADAQHLAAELSGRFYYDRPPLNSEALHVNSSYITAVANDYGYDFVFSRLIDAIGKKGDVLIGLSTSGNSVNVIKAIERARNLEMVTACFTGETGGAMKSLGNYLINIPSTDTPRIQECHMLLGHTICELVELKLFPKN